jgi:hypothetical protein
LGKDCLVLSFPKPNLGTRHAKLIPSQPLQESNLQERFSFIVILKYEFTFIHEVYQVADRDKGRSDVRRDDVLPPGRGKP